jgi:hypothetical protein
MNLTTQVQPINEIYTLFESHIRESFKLLKIAPLSIKTGIKHYHLPTLPNPSQDLELTVEFPGATCTISFGQSEIHTYLFYSKVEFNRQGQPPLSLKDYLANSNDQRKSYLRFRDTELTLDQGISRIAEVLVELFNNELYHLLAGMTWITAPFDWEGYK